MSRATTLVNLYKTAVQEYTKSPDEWRGLLSAIARYYKRSFDNAVLVYAQRPDFTQLATFDEWHDSRINRSINKGAKGIAVIDMSNPGASFKYLFDFMDTNGTDESFRAVLKYHWELEEQYHQGVIQNFHERYGTSLDSMESCLSDFVKTKISQGLADLKGFQVTDESSILFEMPVEAVKAEFIDLLTDSVLYAVFYKCNIPTAFLGDDSFQIISHFNSTEMFMVLGNYTVSITRGVLKEVYQQIEAIKQERSAAHEKRTVNPITVSGESGRDDDSRLTDIIQSGDRPSSNREIRPAVETVHDGEPSPAVEPADRGGDYQRDDYQGGQRGRDGERKPDSSTAERITNAGSGRDNEPDSPYESDYNDGRGNRHEHDYIPQSITEQNHNTEPPIELGDSKPSIGGFFVVPPRQTEKVEHAEESVLELVPDTQKDDIPEEEPSTQLQAELPVMDNALPDRLLMVDEEHFEFVDEFLNSTDWIPLSKWRSWREFLVAINDGYYDSEARNKDIQEFYDTLNIDYMLLGEEVHIDGHEDGLVFTIDNQQLLVAYDVVRKRLESLILQGDIKELDQESFDEYAIPDEPESMSPVSAGGNGVPGYLGTYQINLFDAFGADDDTDMDAEIQVEEMEPVQEESTQEKLSEPSVLPIHEYDDNQGEIEMQEPKPYRVPEESGISYPNYRFSEEHHLYEGGAKTKCRNNIAAIRLLKELQEQGRNANEEEQIILARFVGWGGLANALTPGKSGWESEYEEIRSLLTEEEFLSAQQSTITAYYTEQMIVNQMYAALEKFGFRSGNILDPAMGTGNFYSVLPESMQESRLYGVELDTVSGCIAKQLYPGAEIQVKGYEHCNYPDQFFDVVIGNFPFNSVRINDRKYDRHNFRIHEYFFAKSFDQVRPGGIVAAITSKYMMDKANSSVRKYIAQRAELMGAIRLPNTAFKAVAGTEVTSDILFFKKREREVVPDDQNSPWLYIEENEDGIPMNCYFLDHPEMVLGTMVFDESMFGNEKTTACHPDPEDDLAERLERAVYYLEGSYEEADSEYADERTALEETLPADPNVRNFSYAVVDDAIYFQEHSQMYKQDISGKKAERIKGMVELTGLVRDLIAFQADTDYADRDLTKEEFEEGLQSRLKELNQTYDRFVSSNGPVNNRTNVSAFSRDSNAPLLRSIEQENKQQKGVYEKTPMFYKATIKPRIIPKTVFTVEDGIKVSLNQKGRLDLAFMTEIYRKPDNSQVTKDEIIEALGDRIYQDPAECLGEPYSGWKLAEEYLSGYVKDKLTEAILAAEDEPERFERNVTALKAVQPDMIKPEEINFSLGTTWIPTEVYKRFMYDTLQTMVYNRMGNGKIDIEFSKYNGAYFISNKGREKESVAASQTYGTSRISGYEILETSLNLRSVEVRDRVDYMDPYTGEDKVKYVLNRNETILAREKQAQLKAQFETWLFAKPERAAQLTKLYNDRFNNIRPRVYHGDDLEFPDLSDEITFRMHQRDVVAMGIYSDGNLLMAHEVGAGKTFAAIALTYELKRLGKVNKPLIAVPNHLLGQWADDFMRLYPQANILVAEKKDFERRNRRRFASRIATGDFDAVIMAHSSFELIGLSRERQLAAMRTEIEAISEAIDYEKARSGKGWSLKQMQIFRSNMQSRYDKLFNADKKDDVISFEELGVDCLVVDEAHAYKNNFSYTKMHNVAGISGQSSQRAMDMYQKTQYINEIGNGKGVIYLTGTPVSNSMAELYVMQKTLQPKALEERGLLMFDAWASTFGKVETSLEIKPEGNGYQMKNRFSKFHNIPELMSMLNMVADIKTSEMLDLPVPKLKTGGVQVIKTKITPEQKQMILEMGERAENIRSGTVDSSEDNFLKLTHEARLLAVDPRAIDPNLPDDPDTKLNVCANNVAKIYHETAGQKSTQLIFCDQGTPKADGSFNFYETTRQSLIAKGVKPEEIAFIHDAKSDTQRDELFERVRNGEIRILMGSTDKMGTGMNVQKKLIALHHLDVPWRPSDLIQRNGRVLRQGNENEEVSIFNYITENTFDAYLWQILEQKQRYISQIMTGRSALRSCEDIDDTVLQYAEFKALATSDPRIKEKMETDNEISRLTVLKSAWQTKKNELHQKVVSHYPVQIAQAEKRVEGIEKDVQTFRANRPGEFAMVLNGKIHSERAKAAEHLRVLFRKVGRETGSLVEIGTYAGFPLQLVRLWNDCLSIQLRGNVVYTTEAGESELGNITRIERLAERIDSMKTESEQALLNLKQQFDAAKAEVEVPFSDENRLADLQKRKVELDLNLEFKGGGDVMESESTEKVAVLVNDEKRDFEQEENGCEESER
ncbi:MAG: SNF2-related protein [Lachnospiraceae bacterium]